MKGITLESNNLRLEIMPEGQELFREVRALASGDRNIEKELTGAELAVIVGEALMYYRILLDQKASGTEIYLKKGSEEVKLPVVSSLAD